MSCLSYDTWYNGCMNTHDASLILLTYKGKILLMHRDSSPITQNPWTLIEGEKEKHVSFEQTIFRKVQKETKVKLAKIHLLSVSLFDNRQKYFYHADLTDKDVNAMQRDEQQTLQFFTLREVDKLTLTPSTRTLLSKHRTFLEMPHN